MARYREQLGFYSCSVPLFDQYVLARFISQGYFERHSNACGGRTREKLNKTQPPAMPAVVFPQQKQDGHSWVYVRQYCRD